MKTKKVHDEIINIKCDENVENSELNAALKLELSHVKHKINSNEKKLVALTEGSKEKVYRHKKISESKAKCDFCDKLFNTKTEMEAHIDSDHNIANLNCDKCENVFVSKWRLKMHQKMHTQKHQTRNCHNFNSGKQCPFQALGCKFQHVLSSDCKYGVKCTFSMCQFNPLLADPGFGAISLVSLKVLKTKTRQLRDPILVPNYHR